MAKILAVDDDRNILRLLKNVLELSENEVDATQSALSINLSDLKMYDLILLDVMMPDIDGFSFCQKIRDDIQCPIIFLTAKTEEDSIVKGLLSGGDDYIKKPFGVMELNARVEAHLRREKRKKQSKKVTLDRITIYLDKHEITVGDQSVTLTKNQYNICEFLAVNRGMVFSKEQIYEAVYSIDSDTLINTITEHIRVARNKFKELGSNPIETIWGVGYKWK